MISSYIVQIGTTNSVTMCAKSRGNTLNFSHIIVTIHFLSSLARAEGYSTSILTIARLPLETARCRGDLPSKLFRSTSALFSIKSLHVSDYWFMAAWLRAVNPNWSGMLTSALDWMSLISTSFWPRLAAMCSAVQPPVVSLRSTVAHRRNRLSTHARFPLPQAICSDVYPA